MLRGQVFSEQVFSNECFAHFINTFLNKKNGVTKGCNITNTNNSITVNAGYFCIQGRFLEVVGSDTLQITPNTEYCKLICEIDLSQTNTETQFNQASFKVLSGTSSYPTLTKQDLENGGSIYQFEFAQFQNTTSGIINLKDTRTFLDFNVIYAEIQEEYREILEQLQAELANVEDGSAYVLKTGGTIKGNLIVEGGITGNVTGNLEGNAKTATTASSCTGNSATATIANTAKACTRK